MRLLREIKVEKIIAWFIVPIIAISFVVFVQMNFWKEISEKFEETSNEMKMNSEVDRDIKLFYEYKDKMVSAQILLINEMTDVKSKIFEDEEVYIKHLQNNFTENSSEIRKERDRELTRYRELYNIGQREYWTKFFKNRVWERCEHSYEWDFVDPEYEVLPKAEYFLQNFRDKLTEEHKNILQVWINTLSENLEKVKLVCKKYEI